MKKVRKWSKLLTENLALEMIMRTLDRKYPLTKEGWFERDYIVKLLKTKCQKDYPTLTDRDLGNMIDWLSARYTEIKRLKPTLKQLEDFVEKFDRERIRRKWAYRRREF